MKGKIDKHGYLRILRVGQYVLQECRLGGLNRSDVGEYGYFEPCGHQCSLFGEPDQPHDPGETMLQLCKLTLIFDELIDEREGEI